ncbi:MAG: thioredoxin family protein [Caulobacter sp.]
MSGSGLSSRRGVLAGVAGLTLAGGPTLAAPGKVRAPRVPLTLAQLPKPLPKPYDEQATPAQAAAAIDGALARAAKANRRVIVDLGGNWCSWCRMLAAVMELPNVRPFMAENFDVVMINFFGDKPLNKQNQAALKRLSIADLDGVPWLVVMEPNGRILASSYEVTDEDHETPQLMIDWIAQWALRAPRA